MCGSRGWIPVAGRGFSVQSSGWVVWLIVLWGKAASSLYCLFVFIEISYIYHFEPDWPAVCTHPPISFNMNTNTCSNATTKAIQAPTLSLSLSEMEIETKIMTNNNKKRISTSQISSVEGKSEGPITAVVSPVSHQHSVLKATAHLYNTSRFRTVLNWNEPSQQRLDRGGETQSLSVSMLVN